MSRYWLLVALVIFILGFGAGYFGHDNLDSHIQPLPAPTISNYQLPNGDAFND